MKEFVEKLIERLEDAKDRANRHYNYGDEVAYRYAIEIVNQLAEEYNNGWIPCSKELPPQPKENPLFGNKPLELYLVSLNSTDYPWRAFWNGKYFTDGWSRVEPEAWQPLPEPYIPKQEEQKG